MNQKLHRHFNHIVNQHIVRIKVPKTISLTPDFIDFQSHSLFSALEALKRINDPVSCSNNYQQNFTSELLFTNTNSSTMFHPKFKMQMSYTDISRSVEKRFGSAYNEIQSCFEKLIGPLVKTLNAYSIEGQKGEMDVPDFLLSLQQKIPHFQLPNFEQVNHNQLQQNMKPQMQKSEELRLAIQRTLDKIQPKAIQEAMNALSAKPSMKSYVMRAKSASAKRDQLNNAGNASNSNNNTRTRQSTPAIIQNNNTGNMDMILKIKENQFKLQLQQQQQQYEQQIANLQLQQQQQQSSEISKIKENLYKAENELNNQRQQLQEQLQAYQAQQQELQFERAKIQQFKKTLIQQQKSLQEQKQQLDEQQRLSIDLQQQQITKQMKQMLEEKQQFEQQFALDRVQKHNELKELEQQLLRVQNEIEEKQRQLSKLQLQQHQKQINEQYIIQNLNQCNTKSFDNTFTMNTGKCMDFLGVEGITKIEEQDTPTSNNFQEPRNLQQMMIPSQSTSVQQTLHQKSSRHGSAGSPDSVETLNKPNDITQPSQSESPEVIENKVNPDDSAQKTIQESVQYKIPLRLWPDIDKVEVPVAQWAVGRMLQQNVVKSAKLKPEEVFGQIQDAPSVKNLFGIQNHPFDSRNRVTQNWSKDKLKDAEIASYYKQTSLNGK